MTATNIVTLHESLAEANLYCAIPKNNDRRELEYQRRIKEHRRVAKMEVDMMRRLRGTEQTVEWMLQQNGFLDDEALEKKNNAPEALLKSVIPVQHHQEKGIFILGLENGVLKTAVTGAYNPDDLKYLAETVGSLGYNVDSYAYPEPIDRATALEKMGEIRRITADVIQKSIERVEEEISDGESVKALAQNIIVEALEKSASDIHLLYKPDSYQCTVRYRVNGDARVQHILLPDVMKAVCSRLKQEANVEDFSLRDMMQDGRLSIEWQGRKIDARLASKPVEPGGGEAITLRLLDKGRLLPLNTLLAPLPKVLKRLKRVFNPPTKMSGQIFLCGSMGSGKTTTMAAMQMDIDRLSKVVTEIANPIEYIIPHVRQSEVFPEKESRSYAKHTSAEMRHDSDFVFVGETKDSLTAIAAGQVTQSGHTTITTLHTPNAEGAFSRISGLFPQNERNSYLGSLAETLTMIIHQRLAPTLCGHCCKKARAGDVASPQQLKIFNLHPDDVVYEPNFDGCSHCADYGRPGYRSRVMIPEVIMLPESAEKRRLIAPYFEKERWSAMMGDDNLGIEYYGRDIALSYYIKFGSIDVHMATDILGDTDNDFKDEDDE